MDVSVSAGQGIQISWGPSGLDEPMMWELFYYDEARAHVEECYKNTTLYDFHGGDLEDTGSFTIPWDVLPKNIPEYGCPIAIKVRRVRQGKLDPDIKAGFARAYQSYTIMMTLKP